MGWERLQGNAFIKGEVEHISNKQASLSRRERALTALSQAKQTEEGGQTSRMQQDGGAEAGCQLATRWFLAGR